MGERQDAYIEVRATSLALLNDDQFCSCSAFQRLFFCFGNRYVFEDYHSSRKTMF